MANEATSLDVWINGELRQVRPGLTVRDLLGELGVRVEGVAVEINRDVVRRQDHATCAIAAGDRIEIVQFVGGG